MSQRARVGVVVPFGHGFSARGYRFPRDWIRFGLLDQRIDIHKVGWQRRIYHDWSEHNHR